MNTLWHFMLPNQQNDVLKTPLILHSFTRFYFKDKAVKLFLILNFDKQDATFGKVRGVQSHLFLCEKLCVVFSATLIFILFLWIKITELKVAHLHCHFSKDSPGSRGTYAPSQNSLLNMIHCCLLSLTRLLSWEYSFLPPWCWAWKRILLIAQS